MVGTRCCFSSVSLLKNPALFIVFFLFIFPSQSFATSGIAQNVAAACAPEPTVPDVGSCSACHSTTNNRGPNDLTAAGMWALSPSTFMNFCPTATPTPPPTPVPPPTPTPPPGMSPSPTPGMGMGSGASSDDDDDDGRRESDDDDDAEMDDDDGGGSSGSLRSLRSRLRALQLRRD
ncbi:MAG: hypothetical protein PVG89_00405 [Gammaproteobacteria bacterium]|jgi:hypothetical protein